MTNEKMTIHKALSELKVLDSRICSAISEGKFCEVNKHSNQKISGKTIEEINQMIQGQFDKASDLIKRRNAIKRAVVLSNAGAQVEINGITYTVAEAIEMKNHGMEFKEELRDELKTQYNKAQAKLFKENGDDLSKRAEQFVIDMYGQKESKTNSDEFIKAKESFIKSNSYDMLDPIDIYTKINALDDEINAFQSEVDAVLSTSNALTVIEVEY